MLGVSLAHSKPLLQGVFPRWSRPRWKAVACGSFVIALSSAVLWGQISAHCASVLDPTDLVSRMVTRSAHAFPALMSRPPLLHDQPQPAHHRKQFAPPVSRLESLGLYAQQHPVHHEELHLYPASLSRRDLLLDAAGAIFLSLGIASTPANAASALSDMSVGLGTCCLDDEAATRTMVRTGLRLGYRFIDTASHYGTLDAIVGAVADEVQRGTLQADEVQIGTKIWIDDMVQGYGRVREVLEQEVAVLRQSGIPAFEQVLLHFPGSLDTVADPKKNQKIRAAAWQALEQALDDGLTRSIGVSNFEPRHLKPLLKQCKVRPSMSQIEVHPYFQNKALAEYCRNEGIALQSISPLAHGDLPALLSDPTLQSVASAHAATPSQVILHWLLQKGVRPIAFSTNEKHLKENLDSTSITLTSEEMTALDFLDKGTRSRVGFDPNQIA
eukprot:gnl/TRDRNA2_/TRDRNA2_127608_c0_seq1.p1 gnl/TRDRNA2_/TRDRNA2_127608_c0~~gnl/TRDRNA2_/TRDRNA2_127608_c0_seq1.p1  ORF type:complete len:464 (-),score=53.37 gnl/TRDRNA2_/TRDRNA2_127608_c0_seq1:35-1357(-)